MRQRCVAGDHFATVDICRFSQRNLEPTLRHRRRGHSTLLAAGASVLISPYFPVSDSRDALTGLLDRATILMRLDRACATEQPVALLALDLDRFKSVNDSGGMAVGDAILREAAERIVQVIPAHTPLARIGSDEFAVLLPSTADLPGIAKRALELMRRPFTIDGRSVSLTVSIGSALSPPHASSASELLRVSGIALHCAEKSGGDCWREFEPWMLESASVQQSMETALRLALDSHQKQHASSMVVEQFELHYQPQVTVEGRRLAGFEALVRWRHPMLGLVGPGEFVPLAEATGLIDRLGDWVLRAACRDAASWPNSEFGTPLQVAVNVSPYELRDRGALAERVRHVLRDSGLAPERLEIEITESALNRDALEALRELKALRVRLSLDDFGTGYSSLSQLAQYPFDRLKIDRTFVRDLRATSQYSIGSPTADRNGPAMWMIQAIASLGAGLHLDTVAEGVETESQAELVRQAGATLIQGFLISRPIPAADVATWIRAYEHRDRSPRVRFA